MSSSKKANVKLATNNNATKEVTKMTKDTTEEKRQSVLSKTEEIKKIYQSIRKMESNINAKTYQLGKELSAIVKDKSFKVLHDSKSQKYTFQTYCEKMLGFSNKYAYMLISAAELQDLLENESLTVEKQGHHQLRKLCKYMKQVDVLKEIWKKASGDDQKCVPNIADLTIAIKSVEAENEQSASEDPVESAYNNIKKWVKLDKLTNDQRNDLLERLSKLINDIEESEDREND